MGRRRQLGLWLVVTAGLVAGCGRRAAPPPPDPPQTVRVRNYARGFSLAVPQDWEQADGYQLTALAAVGPTTTADLSRPTLNVTVEPKAKPITVDAYYQLSVTNLGGAIQDFRAVEQGSSQLAGLPARWLCSTYTNGEHPVQSLAWFVLDDRQAYVITCAADPAVFATWRPVFEQLAGSFRLERPAPQGRR